VWGRKLLVVTALQLSAFIPGIESVMTTGRRKTDGPLKESHYDPEITVKYIMINEPED
jgi:hypothetical protein